MRRKIAALLAALLSATMLPASAEVRPSPQAARLAAADCANPKVPAAILDGRAFATDPQPLAFRHYASGATKLTLAVAGDGESRELGLMCVLRLKPAAGMIFVFDRSDVWEFWMKNTLIRLDMLWVEENGTISAIAANVPKSTRTTPDDKIARRRGLGRFVVELAAGEAKRLGLKTGAKLGICRDGSPPEELDGGFRKCGRSD